MKRFALSLILALLSVAAFAQTYDIPDGTGIEYIFYNASPQYTNTIFGSYPLTLGGVLYETRVNIHFTEGDPAATSGAITFTHYTTLGSTSITEYLSNINYDPFTLKTATATAEFTGQFNGSLTLNIQQTICYRGHCSDEVTTVNGVHSNFTIAQ